MFNKKTCGRCGKKINKKDSFCPNCGAHLERKEEDFGMIGNNDSFEKVETPKNSLLGGISGSLFNKMFTNTMKMLEKEMEKEMQKGKSQKSQNNFPKTRVKLMINGKEVNLNERSPTNNKNKEQKKKLKFNSFTNEQIKKFSKLPKKEPSTNLKRIANKISYEIEIPEVESFSDVSILPLENSIEIKAVSKKKAYSKSIQISLPIIDYTFSKGLLVLEFQGN